MPEAIEHYGAAIKSARTKWGYRASRARVYYLIGSDSLALSDLNEAIAEWRKDDDDDKESVRLYHSKALLEHSAGLVHERAGRLDAARDAYSRALQEDLSYYPAHVRLGLLALANGDTAAALSSSALAIQVKEDAPELHYTHGALLFASGKHSEAAASMKRAVELEPFFAAPYLVLGITAEMAGDAADALGQYRAFVERASKRDGRYDWARQKVEALTAALGSAQ